MVTLHELGHSLSIGEVDDNRSRRLPFSEVYSGDSRNDNTIERVDIRGSKVTEWSIMRSGWNSESLIYHGNTGYHVYSLEELLSVQEYNNG